MPDGEVTADNYELQESPMPSPAEGELLVEALWCSVDPYMRIQQARSDTWEEPHPLGKVQGGGVVGRVVVSKDAAVPVGSVVNCYTGWASHAVVKAADARVLDADLAPVSTALGVLGMVSSTVHALRTAGARHAVRGLLGALRSRQFAAPIPCLCPARMPRDRGVHHTRRPAHTCSRAARPTSACSRAASPRRGRRWL